MEQVKLYDTTLRDGMGGRGMSLSVGEKLKVAQALDALGVQFIEAGFPSSNPKEAELFERLAEVELENATFVAFGMTRRRDRAAAEDEALAVLTSSFAPAVCLVGKSSPLHVEKVIRVSREENLAMIADSIAFCREQGKRAIFDAEHFFDGYREDSAYALECVAAAAGAGAENVTLCDTNGGSLPSFVAEATAAVVAAVGAEVEIGIHTHDDSGCGVANSLAAVEAGARLVQGCVNGYGERCGNANLASILPALQLKMGYEVVTAEQLASLTSPLTTWTRSATSPPTRTGPTSAATPSPTRRGCTPPGSPPTPAPSSTSTRPRSATSATRRLRAGRQGDDPQPGRARRHRARRRGRDPGGAAAEGARAPRLPLRGGAGLLRAAAAARGQRDWRRWAAGMRLNHAPCRGSRAGDLASAPLTNDATRRTVSVSAAPARRRGRPAQPNALSPAGGVARAAHRPRRPGATTRGSARPVASAADLRSVPSVPLSHEQVVPGECRQLPPG